MTDTDSHEYKHSITDDVYYPDHPNPRGESPTFRAMKENENAQGVHCAISGQKADVEEHHVFCEWAWADAIDWSIVKAVAIGIIVKLPVLDLETDQPTSETYPVESSLLWMVIQITKARGFDWATFDPLKPETFVDSWANMLPLHKKFHRAPQHGAHAETAPIWGFQMFPRKPCFVYSPDELVALHSKQEVSHG